MYISSIKFILIIIWLTNLQEVKTFSIQLVLDFIIEIKQNQTVFGIGIVKLFEWKFCKHDWFWWQCKLVKMTLYLIQYGGAPKCQITLSLQLPWYRYNRINRKIKERVWRVKKNKINNVILNPIWRPPQNSLLLILYSLLNMKEFFRQNTW